MACLLIEVVSDKCGGAGHDERYTQPEDRPADKDDVKIMQIKSRAAAQDKECDSGIQRLEPSPSIDDMPRKRCKERDDDRGDREHHLGEKFDMGYLCKGMADQRQRGDNRDAGHHPKRGDKQQGNLDLSIFLWSDCHFLIG